MKHLLLILALLAVVSCSAPTEEQAKKFHEREVARITRHFHKIEYEGHSYIFYERTHSNGISTTALSHDPDCHCLYSITD